MQDLKLQHVSGHYKNFTRMPPTDFIGNLFYLIKARLSVYKSNFQKRHEQPERT
jgi:hypothetical protein